MRTNQIIEEVISKKYKVAVIGASNNPEKYGYKVFKDLQDKGFDLTPVNLKEKEILGITVVPTIDDLKDIKHTVLDFIVPPLVTKEIVKKALAIGFDKFWFQPGSYDDEVIGLLENEDVDVMKDVCIMRETDEVS